MNKNPTLQLMIAGTLVHVALAKEMTPAHGTGLDGKTQVKSLGLGKSHDHPDNILVKDAHGNVIITTADELFAATKIAGEEVGFAVTATKIG